MNEQDVKMIFKLYEAQQSCKEAIIRLEETNMNYDMNLGMAKKYLELAGNCIEFFCDKLKGPFDNA